MSQSFRDKILQIFNNLIHLILTAKKNIRINLFEYNCKFKLN